MNRPRTVRVPKRPLIAALSTLILAVVALFVFSVPVTSAAPSGKPNAAPRPTVTVTQTRTVTATQTVTQTSPPQTTTVTQTVTAPPVTNTQTVTVTQPPQTVTVTASPTDPSSTTSTTSPTSTTTTTTPPPGPCPIAGTNKPGAADPWGGCFPGPGNTGVPAGTVLTDYTGSTDIYADNVTIDSKVVRGLIRVGGANFTLRNSLVLGAITVIDSMPQHSMTLVDSKVDGRNANLPDYKSVTGENIAMTRMELTGSFSGGVCSDCTILDSWIHAPYTTPDSPAHMSGYRMDQNTTIKHSSLACDFVSQPGANPEQGCSANLTGYGDWAPVQNNTISRNLLVSSPPGAFYFCAYGGSSGGKPYSGQASNVRFTENVFQRGYSGVCGITGGRAVGDYDPSRPGNVPGWASTANTAQRQAAVTAANNRWDDGSPLTVADFSG